MTVTLTSEQERLVAELLESGHYRSADDVVAQSLGMLRAQEQFIRENTTVLREKVAVGIQQIKKGETVDGPATIRNMRAKLRDRGMTGG
jgi:antitoxin ParD1/3/4